jgi:hypothetical protein
MDMVSFPDKNIFPLQVFGYYYDKKAKWVNYDLKESKSGKFR